MRIYIAGHCGMVGSAILRKLQTQTHHELITAPRARLDLTDQHAVRNFMNDTRPDAVILAAARVGGIMANATFPANFIYENLMIAANVINAAHDADIQRLLFLGSSCIYPAAAPQPMRENALLTGGLEPTNEPYAIAKIAGIKLCESYNRQYGRDYRSIMPTNLYGPGDNFHPETAHVVPALLHRFDDAARKGADRVQIWGSGIARREFMHVDDLAAAALFVLDLEKLRYDAVTTPMQSHLNVGTGQDISISELARMIAKITGFTGAISYDTSKPDGALRKLLDISVMSALGWQARIGLPAGMTATYDWLRSEHSVRGIA